MSPSRTPPSNANAPQDSSRFAALELADADVLIYDREVDTAWVRSDTALELERVA